VSQQPNLPEPSGDGASLDFVPGVARIAATAGWHAAAWAVGTYAKASRRVVGVILAPETGAELVRDVADTASQVVRGVISLAQTGDVNAVTDPITGRHSLVVEERGPTTTLRQEGEHLLRLSRDVRYEVQAHPAYERILSELAPDEGRILRLFLLQGPQPTVDVRTGGPIGMVRSHLIAGGLNMIGARAGCRYVERTPSYLNNLFRLGLIWFSRENVRDHKLYQVLEAQPDVLAAMHSVRSARVIRRSVHLTPFGEDFCRVCLADDVSAYDLATLPEHSAPKSDVPATPAETLES
jgi:hypothetical protein